MVEDTSESTLTENLNENVSNPDELISKKKVLSRSSSKDDSGDDSL